MAALDVPAGPVSDDEIRAAIRRYFAVLQSDPTAEQMRAEAVTDDFRTAMPDGGYQWDGPRGLETFLRDRKGFVDEQHDIDEVLSREDIGEVVWLKTRLTFPPARPEDRRGLHRAGLPHLGSASGPGLAAGRGSARGRLRRAEPCRTAVVRPAEGGPDPLADAPC